MEIMEISWEIIKTSGHLVKWSKKVFFKIFFYFPSLLQFQILCNVHVFFSKIVNDKKGVVLHLCLYPRHFSILFHPSPQMIKKVIKRPFEVHLKKGSSENDARSDVYDCSEFKVVSNCCYPNCCCTNAMLWILVTSH